MRRRIQEIGLGCEHNSRTEQTVEEKAKGAGDAQGRDGIKMAGKITANAHIRARQSASPARVDESIPRNEASWCCRYTWLRLVRASNRQPTSYCAPQ